MDMRIDSDLVRSERERRAWSQEHLASVTGLGLRTITRIETTGRASHESVKALASVFQIEVAALNNERNVDVRSDQLEVDILAWSLSPKNGITG